MSNYINKISYFFKKELNLSEEKREVIAYGMETFVALFLGFIGVLIIAYFMGVFFPALVIALTALLTRAFTGGGHCSTMGKCIIVTVIAMISLALIAVNMYKPSLLMIVLGFLICLLLIIKFAPAEVEEKPLSSNHKKSLKKGAIILWGVLLAIVVLWNNIFENHVEVYLSYGFFWQVFTISPWGFKLLARIDGLIKIKKGERVHEKEA